MLLFSDQSQSLLNEEGPLAVLQQFQGLYRVNLFPPLQPGQWKLQAKSNGHLTFNVIGKRNNIEYIKQITWQIFIFNSNAALLWYEIFLKTFFKIYLSFDLHHQVTAV